MARLNVPKFPISPALESAVLSHNSKITDKAQEITNDKFAKCLEKLSECAKITIDQSNYREIFSLGLGIEEIESEAEIESCSREVRVCSIWNPDDWINYHYKIVYKEPLVDPPVKRQDIVKICSGNSTIYEMRVTSIAKKHLFVKINREEV